MQRDAAGMATVAPMKNFVAKDNSMSKEPGVCTQIKTHRCRTKLEKSQQRYSSRLPS